MSTWVIRYRKLISVLGCILPEVNSEARIQMHSVYTGGASVGSDAGNTNW